MKIPSITYSTYFGPISKVRWYSVTDYFNEYEVELTIEPSQTNSSNVRIENRSNLGGFEWEERILATPNLVDIIRDVQILHIPTLKAVQYVVINQAV